MLVLMDSLVNFESFFRDRYSFFVTRATNNLNELMEFSEPNK